MSATTTFSGNQVKNLITKFFYKDNHLCFQILLEVDKQDFVCFEEYVDYSKYKKAYDELITLKANNSPIIIKQLEYEPTNMNLV